MNLGMPQDATLKDRRREWRRLLSRRRQKISYMYGRSASGCRTTHYRTDAERRDTYRRNADFNSKSSQQEHRNTIRHDTHKLTPKVETPTKDSIYSVHEISEGTRQDARKTTPRVMTPIIAIPTQDSIYNVHEPRKSTRQDTGKTTPGVATLVFAKPTQDSQPQGNHKTRL
jgi:hypothetical protein